MSGDSKKLHRFMQGHRGSLKRQGNVFHNWRSRHFVVEKRRFRCFADEQSVDPVTEFVVDEKLTLYDFLDDVKGTKHVFSVRARNANGLEENVVLSASSEKDKQDWIEAIVDATHEGFRQMFQPDLWPQAFYPTVDMQIVYDKAGPVDSGNILRPLFLESAPQLHLRDTAPDEKFSMLMLDGDPVTVERGKGENFYMQWGIINFNGKDISACDVLASYQPPAPVYNSGLHRYFFVLFKQRTPISHLVLNEVTELFQSRESFSVRKFVKIMNFGAPVALNGFYSQWEECVDRIHRQIGFVPSEPFRSPTQDSAVLAEEERSKAESERGRVFRDFLLADFLGDIHAADARGRDALTISLSFSGKELEPFRHGDAVCLASLQSPPRLRLGVSKEADSTTLFTICLCDADVPSRAQPEAQSFVHWLIVNVPAQDLAVMQASLLTGQIIVGYESPAPFFHSGLHRLTTVVYAQEQTFTDVDIARSTEYFANSKTAVLSTWVSDMSTLIVPRPVALALVLIEWEPICDQLHAARGIVPPDRFKSPLQISKVRETADKKNKLKITVESESLNLLPHMTLERDATVLQNKDKELLELLRIFRSETVVTETRTQESYHEVGTARCAPGMRWVPVTSALPEIVMQQTTTRTTQSTLSSLFASDQVDFSSLYELHGVTNVESLRTVHVPLESDEEKMSRKTRLDLLQMRIELESKTVDESFGVSSVDLDEVVYDLTMPLQLSETAHCIANTLESVALMDSRSVAPSVDLVSEVESNSSVENPLPLDANLTRNEASEHDPELQRPLHERLSKPVKSLMRTQSMNPDYRDRDRSKVIQQEVQREAAGVPQHSHNHQHTHGHMHWHSHRDSNPRNTAGGSIGAADRLPSTIGNNEPTKSLSRTLSMSPKFNKDSNRASRIPLESGVEDFVIPELSEREAARSFEDPTMRPKVAVIGTKAPAISANVLQPDSAEVDRASDSKYVAHRHEVGHQHGLPAHHSAEERSAVDNIILSDEESIPQALAESDKQHRSPVVEGVDNDPVEPVIADATSFQHQPVGIADSPRNLSEKDNGGKPLPSAFEILRMSSRMNKPLLTHDPDSLVGDSPRPPSDMSSSIPPSPHASAESDSASDNGSVSSSSTPSRNKSSSQSRTDSKNPRQTEKARDRALRGATTVDKCRIMGVSSPSIFDGETMRKKYSSDFMAKDSVIWVEPITRSLHWSKSIQERNTHPHHSKYILLDPIRPPAMQPLGEAKGVLSSVELQGLVLHVKLHSGEHLELKMSGDGDPPAVQRANDWLKALRSFLS